MPRRFWILIALAAAGILLAPSIFSFGDISGVPEAVAALVAAVMSLAYVVLLIAAVLDIRGVVHQHADGEWATSDVLWVLAVLGLQFIGALAWFLAGRSIRIRELDRARTDAPTP